MLLMSTAAYAGEADVIGANVRHITGDVYNFDVTVRHTDEGWKHYADKWDVTAPDGTILGTRILAHPHVDEQPFTRSLGDVEVPVGAVFTPETEDNNYVWVIDEPTGVVRQQGVVTGELVREGIQVLEGLKPGDWVAIAGVHTLREGQQVSIMTDAGE